MNRNEVTEMKELRIYGYDLPLESTDEEVIERGEELGEVYTKDNFFFRLNVDELFTSTYNYRAIEIEIPEPKPSFHISKVVYTEMTDDEFYPLYDKDVIRFTDYDTYEILADDVQELLKELQELEVSTTDDEVDERLEELREIRANLNETLGEDLVDMLDNNKVDTVMVIR